MTSLSIRTTKNFRFKVNIVYCIHFPASPFPFEMKIKLLNPILHNYIIGNVLCYRVLNSSIIDFLGQIILCCGVLSYELWHV